MEGFAVLMAILMGISLSAASGFRVFLPPFLLSIVARFDLVWFLDLNPNWYSIRILHFDTRHLLSGIATIAEFAGYYVTWIDNALDTIATPTSILAGIAMTAIVLGTDPIIQWAIAVIAGGGVSATIQSATVATKRFEFDLHLWIG